MSLRSISMAFVVAVFAGWVIALPSLRKLARLNPLALFQEASHPGSQKSQVGLPFFIRESLPFGASPCCNPIPGSLPTSSSLPCLSHRFFCTWSVFPDSGFSSGHSASPVSPPFGFPFPCPQPEQFDYRFPRSRVGGCCCLA